MLDKQRSIGIEKKHKHDIFRFFCHTETTFENSQLIYHALDHARSDRLVNLNIVTDKQGWVFR